MSGGAVLDQSGKLLGVISRGFETDTNDGPTYATRVTELLERKLRLSWPPGEEHEPVALHDIPPELLELEGRDRIHVLDGQVSYEGWR